MARTLGLLMLSVATLGDSKTHAKIKSLCCRNAPGKLRIGGLFSAVIPALGLAPCHGGVGPTTTDEALEREGRGGTDKALDFDWASASPLNWFL